ncbi:MAG: hypothetical protein HY555_03035 [Euryarchaeota archaeon]|nr:hypothetical protein [Euryarchaeota archaeon]
MGTGLARNLVMALNLGLELVVSPLFFAAVGYLAGRSMGEGWGILGAVAGIFLGLYVGIRNIARRQGA